MTKDRPPTHANKGEMRPVELNAEALTKTIKKIIGKHVVSNRKTRKNPGGSKLDLFTPGKDDKIVIIEKPIHSKEKNVSGVDILKALNPFFERYSLPYKRREEIALFVFKEISIPVANSQESSASSHSAVNSDTSAKSTLPSVAPARWKADKLARETPPAFIKRVYSEWLGNGLDRPTVRHLDPALGQALDNWLRKNEMPADVDLPTAKERSAREIAALQTRAKGGNIKDVVGSFTLREAQRIEANIRRHKKQK